MLIHDPFLFSLVVPTFQEPRFVRRVLDYFRHIAFEGQIVIADNSAGAAREVIAQCPRDYPDLDLQVHAFPEEVRFLDKMVAVLEKIDSRFVMLHAHDDFVIPVAAEQCVQHLASHADYSVARGRTAMVSLSRRQADSAVQVSLVPHPMRAYEQDDAAERVMAHIERYNSTFYSVHRRDTLIESFRRTEAATKNVIFFQYLSSCISVLRGKVYCAEALFYVRQGHEQSWSAQLKNAADYEHWPMLITSPDFSRYYHEFRDALATLLADDCGGTAGVYGERIDRAALGLFQRGFCGVERDNPQEARFMERLEQDGSEESRMLRSIVQFAVRYPDTV